MNLFTVELKDKSNIFSAKFAISLGNITPRWRPRPAGLAQLIGQTGTAATPLRPSGTMLVAGRRVDAITGGEFLERGTPVRIVRTEGSGVIVHRQD